jgi:hypothetical protein
MARGDIPKSAIKVPDNKTLVPDSLYKSLKGVAKKRKLRQMMRGKGYSHSKIMNILKSKSKRKAFESTNKMASVYVDLLEKLAASSGVTTKELANNILRTSKEQIVGYYSNVKTAGVRVANIADAVRFSNTIYKAAIAALSKEGDGEEYGIDLGSTNDSSTEVSHACKCQQCGSYGWDNAGGCSECGGDMIDEEKKAAINTQQQFPGPVSPAEWLNRTAQIVGNDFTDEALDDMDLEGQANEIENGMPGQMPGMPGQMPVIPGLAGQMHQSLLPQDFNALSTQPAAAPKNQISAKISAALPLAKMHKAPHHLRALLGGTHKLDPVILKKKKKCDDEEEECGIKEKVDAAIAANNI